MAIAGWVNLRKKGRTDKLSFGGLLSPLGRAIWWGSKTSISPLIHFSISAWLMMRAPRQRIWQLGMREFGKQRKPSQLASIRGYNSLRQLLFEQPATVSFDLA